MSELIHFLIRDAARRSPGSVALKYGKKSVDYGTLWDRLSAAAEGFAVIGLKRGERRFYVEKRPETVIASFAVAAGVYVARILERKTSRDSVDLITDSGHDHRLPASGNFGQLIRRNYPVAIGNRLGGGPHEADGVIDRLCTRLDLIAGNVELPRAELGDLFVLFQSGAGGLMVCPIRFLGHTPPLEMRIL